MSEQINQENEEMEILERVTGNETESSKAGWMTVGVLLGLVVLVIVLLSLAAGAGIFYMVTKEPATVGRLDSDSYEYKRVDSETYVENFPAEQFQPTEYTTYDGDRLDAFYGCPVLFGDVTLGHVDTLLKELADRGVEPKLWYPGDADADGMVPAMPTIQEDNDAIGASMDYFTYRGSGHEYLFGFYECKPSNGRVVKEIEYFVIQD